VKAFTVIECQQRSEEWVKARLGRLCGSRASDMLATRQDGKPAAGRANLRTQLVLERLTGKPQESTYQSPAMQAGVENEADALLLYEALTGQLVERTGFLSHNAMLAGCSLDGHVGDFEGIVEAKCPLPATHLEYIRSGKVPGDYQKQILHSLWITGAQWCDWLSYQPSFPEHLQVRIVRIERNEVAIDEYEQKARLFLAEVERDIETLNTMTNMRRTLSLVVGASA
jgi:hypothetical protein